MNKPQLQQPELIIPQKGINVHRLALFLGHSAEESQVPASFRYRPGPFRIQANYPASGGAVDLTIGTALSEDPTLSGVHGIGSSDTEAPDVILYITSLLALARNPDVAPDVIIDAMSQLSVSWTPAGDKPRFKNLGHAYGARFLTPNETQATAANGEQGGLHAPIWVPVENWAVNLKRDALVATFPNAGSTTFECDIYADGFIVDADYVDVPDHAACGAQGLTVRDLVNRPAVRAALRKARQG